MARSVSRSSVSRESVQASAELLKSLREKLWDTLEILAPRPLPASPEPDILVRFLDSWGLTMPKHILLILSLLGPAFLGLGGYAALKAQQKTSPAASGKRWSDAATWPDKKVPGKDAVVNIEKDMNVVLDVSPPPLRSLTINGKLSFADNKDLELSTE